MKKFQELNLNAYFKYKQFIQICSNKVYASELVLHAHHIIPKHLGGNDTPDNLVFLSVEDHTFAHLMLADCFELGTDANIHNLRSARILDNKSIKLTRDLNVLSESMRGANNHFFGQAHTPETIAKIQQTKQLNGSTNLGKTYSELYGARAKEEQEKRRVSVVKRWAEISQEDKQQRVLAIKRSLAAVPKRCRGANPNSKRVKVAGVEYASLSEACSMLETNRYFLFKNFKVEYINE